MTDCVVMYDEDNGGHNPGYPPHCPACGRCLKWEGKEYSCKCNRIMTIPGSGELDWDDSDYAVRVCIIPQSSCQSLSSEGKEKPQ